MHLERHVQLVPGQARILLVAEAKVCAFWRDAITARMNENYRRQMVFNLDLAHAYRLPVEEIESVIQNDYGSDAAVQLRMLQEAYAQLQNIIYGHSSITAARSKIIEAMAAICACDGALCRMVRRGKIGRARELGEEVIPLAREFTNLRLELYKGNAARILHHCEDLSLRTLKQLGTIRENV